ncbi:hypothetical protein BC833DRAFT_574454 [Globomyces pollinis-pini]|nr:hypothetical protein BC833DRAFT_574454 [Globomyces pollinis-pini]
MTASKSNQNNWKSPTKKPSVNVDVVVLCRTNDISYSFSFPPGILLVKSVKDAIVGKLQITPKESKMFSLWILTKDLELQLRETDDLACVLTLWNNWTVKYTHVQSVNTTPSFTLVYKREAACTIAEEELNISPTTTALLFGDILRLIELNRVHLTQMNAAMLAGIKLHLNNGEFQPTQCSPGYLNIEKLKQLVPNSLINDTSPEEWETLISSHYKSLVGVPSSTAMEKFLVIARNFPGYGSSFFPVCTELSQSKKFEERLQNWLIGIGPKGITITDQNTKV